MTTRNTTPVSQPLLSSNNKQHQSSEQNTPLCNQQPRLSQNSSSRFVFIPLALTVILTVALFLISSHIRNENLLDPTTYRPSTTVPFNLDNALSHISHLASRPRYVGTNALEDGMQYIMSQLHKLQPLAKRNNLHLDVQLFRSDPSSYTIGIANVANLHNSYDNISSVIARLRPAHLPFDTDVQPLLINAHVDSALSAPGASDILCGVGINMEIVRSIISLSSNVNTLRRPIIFLFNGGEEVFLTGAHSFVTQHPWGRVAAAFINLESIGAGNAFHLFRVGPNNPWLGHAFANAVSVPVGSVSGTDIFNTKTIPAETDFRVFHEEGGIPGYDFALLDNGFIYHTTYDDYDHVIHKGVLHGGTTVFELTMELAGKNDAIGVHLSGTYRPHRLSSAATWLAKRLRLMDDSEGEKFVFFEVLFLTLVIYDEGIATVLHLSIVVIVILVWMVKMMRMEQRERFLCLRLVVILPLMIVAGIISSMLMSLLHSEVMNVKFLWYGSTVKALLLYIPPALCGMFAVLCALIPRRPPSNIFTLALLAPTLVNVLLSLTFLRYSIMCAFIPSVSLLVLMFCTLQGNSVPPLLQHLELFMVHAVVFEKLASSILTVVLPLLGRVRSNVLPHDTICAFLVTVICSQYVFIMSMPILSHFAAMVRKSRGVLYMALLWVTVATCAVFLAMHGNSDFIPYSKNAPKRLLAAHFHSPQMTPNSVVQLSSADAVHPDLKRLLLPLVASDENMGSLPKIPTFGSSKADALEAFRLEASFCQSHNAYRSGRKPDLDLPVVEVMSEMKSEDGWNVSVKVVAKDSHFISIGFRNEADSPVMGWSIKGNLSEAGKYASIRHFGTREMTFWLHVQNVRSSEERSMVNLTVTSTRLGMKRSPYDLARLNFTSWESPIYVVSSGLETSI